MKYLHAEFTSHAGLAAAVSALEAAGVAKSEMELYSVRPVETNPPLLPRRSRMSLGAVATAACAGGGVTALMRWVQLDYPLVTGGMPITPGWATAVVTFESTMAGAVAGILVMLLYEGRLLGRRKGRPAPAPPDRGAVLQVRCPTGWEAVAETARAAGAERVEVIEPAP